MLSGGLACSLVCRSARWLNSSKLVAVALMFHMHTCTHMSRLYADFQAHDFAVLQTRQAGCMPLSLQPCFRRAMPRPCCVQKALQ